MSTFFLICSIFTHNMAIFPPHCGRNDFISNIIFIQAIY
nr:MAG TPA: hypothetical protein [Caudoviricetes sp.]